MTKNSTSGSAKGKAKAATNEAIEEIKLASNQLVDRVRDLIEEGNVRHVKIKKEGRVLLEVPMTVGVGAGAAAVLLSPMLAAVGALAALVTDVTLVIERDPDADPNGGPSTASSSSPSGGGSSGASDEATGEPTETPASKPVTPPDSPDKTIGK
jgi:hypothetical protein